VLAFLHYTKKDNFQVFFVYPAVAIEYPAIYFTTAPASRI
jgi:hypothetical protein